MASRGPKPRVEHKGITYTCKAWSVEIPDLSAMTGIEASMWLLRNTIPQGYSKPRPNLAGINVVVR